MFGLDNSHKFQSLVFTLSAMVLLAGCGKGDKNLPVYPVTGIVTYNNKPVEGATVMFRNTSNKSAKVATGLTDAQGKFTLNTYGDADGAAAGDYEVAVSKFSGGETKTGQVSMEDAIDQNKSSAPKAKSEIPLKYADSTQSGLRFTVSESGTNDFKIELK